MSHKIINKSTEVDPYQEEVWDTVVYEEPEKIFYVAIDSISQATDSRIELILDGVSSIWYEKVGSNETLLQTYEGLIPYIFKLNIYFPNLLLPLYKNFIFNILYPFRWFKLTIKQRKSPRIQYFIDDDSDHKTINSGVQSLEPIPTEDPISQRLTNYFSWEGFSFLSEETLSEILQIPNNYHNHLNVYNVGQGSLNAICDSSETPLMYLDIGGGWAFNAKTYPKNQTVDLCWIKARTIILSHWDWDHLETARRNKNTNWNQFAGKNWIAPAQALTPSYAKFAAHISKTGNLFLWPPNLPSFRVNDVEIFKCHGFDKNDSGLAVVLYSNSQMSPLLYPGDAAYRYIPCNDPIGGLVATHHGAQFDFLNSPIPTPVSGYIAYSFGKNNRYKHPNSNAVKAYQLAGWGVSSRYKKRTTRGNVSFSHIGTNNKCSCIKSNCILNKLNYFR